MAAGADHPAGVLHGFPQVADAGEAFENPFAALEPLAGVALQDELAGTENRIAVSRKRYTDSVRIFNTKIRRFPSSSIARMMGLEKKEYFEIEEEAREVPEVDFEN